MKNVIFMLLFIGAWVTCGTSVAVEPATDISSVVVEGGIKLPEMSKEEQEKAEAEAATRLKAVEACVSCHGADGNSINKKYPKLAAQHPAVLKKQINDFIKSK